MMLIATAGHVNHGKTALIRALTGVDADRLPEEKRRGLTIDLGYAYAERPDGRVIGFVDVPGHDHYLHNMIAGVLPLDAVLLVVAADEGVSAQTREHLQILDLVGMRKLLVAITKTDRAGEAAIAATEAGVREALSRTAFAGVAILRVSAETGDGIAGLWQRLDGLVCDLSGPRVDAGFRLPIDRVFTLAGFGTVVTGTVLSGTAKIGARLVLSPSGIAARVRSLHAQNRPAASASAGVRCAVAISGPLVEKDKVRRCDVLVAPALHRPSQRFGTRLKLADGITLRGEKEVQLYHGTARTAARLQAIERDADTGFWLVQLASIRPLAVLHGDRILLRDEGTKRNIAGGMVIDPFTPGRGHSRDARVARLRAMARADHAEALAGLVEAAGFADLGEFCLARNLAPAEAEALAACFGNARCGDVVLSAEARAFAKARLLDGLRDFHDRHPHVLGPRKEQALGFAGRQFSRQAAEAVLADAILQGLVLHDAACIRLKTHRPHLAEADEAVWERLAAVLEAGGVRPPHLGALAELFGMDWRAMEKCLLRLEQFGLLTRVARNRFFLPESIEHFRNVAAGLTREEGSFTAAAFNEKSGVGRNLAIEILEYLDRIGATRREGLTRRLL